MGKLKRNRNNRKARVNPLGNKPTEISAADQKDESTRKSKILPLIKNLTSTTPNDKSMALGALTVICEDSRMRKLCLKEKMVQIIMELCLNDSSDEIVVESFGLLRNIAIEEGYDVITYYWRQNIWAAIEAGLTKVQTSFKFLLDRQNLPNDTKLAKKVDEKAKVQLLYDFTENLVSMVIVLASGLEEIYELIFTKIDPVLDLVLDLLNWQSSNSQSNFSLKLHNSLLDFIYEFSTESLEFIGKLQQSAKFDINKLTPGIETNLLGLGYIEGIKYQIYESSSSNNHGEKQQFITQTLKNLGAIIMKINMENLKSIFTPTDNASEPIQKQQSQPQQTNEKPQDIDQQISGDTPEKAQAKNDVQLLEICIDLFTSIWEFLAYDNSEPLVLSPELVQVIFKSIYPILSDLIQFDISNNQVLQLSNKILVCFNNLSWLMISCESTPTEWFEIATKLWDLSIEISSSPSASKQLEFQKNCLNVCWASIKALGPSINNFNPEMINGLIVKCNDLSKEKELENYDFILSAVGFLGSTAQIISNIELTRLISEFLLSLMNEFTSPEFVSSSSEDKSRAFEIVIESLDLFYDIFGDGEYEYDYPVFVQGDYVNKLKALEGQVKEMYKKIDKNKNKELKSRVEDSWQNMIRFIQYKESERN